MLVRRFSNAAAAIVKRRRPSQEVTPKVEPPPTDVGRGLPSVQHLLKNRQEVMTRYQGNRASKFRVGSEAGDSPAASLGRLYQFFVIGWNTQAAAEVAYFWKQAQWKLVEIADPYDPDVVRRGILVVLIRMLCKDFNALIGKGYKRGDDVVAESSPPPPPSKDEGDWEYEELPDWVKAFGKVYPHEWVHIPDVKGYPTMEDEGLSEEFKEAGILVREPHFRLRL